MLGQVSNVLRYMLNINIDVILERDLVNLNPPAGRLPNRSQVTTVVVTMPQ